jgi:hypothetical protein
MARTDRTTVTNAGDALSKRVLPQYEADDGPLTAAQVRQIKKQVPQGGKRPVRSDLLDLETATGRRRS